VIVPDKFGTEIGWRGWHVRERDKRVFLYSIVHQAVWIPEEAMEALCSKAHAAPAARCTCGIYAARTLGHLREMVYHTAGAFGEVHLWGSVVHGQFGWRAQYAYPKRIYIPHESYRLVAPLKATYGVPVNLINPYTGEVNEHR
jgi:hypothetical protein